MHKKLFLFFAVLSIFLSGCGDQPLVGCTPPAKDGYLIRNVSVFTAVPDRPVLEDMDVLVRDGTVTRISPERLDAPGAVVIDGRGKTLLPGLTDFHTHTQGGMIIPWDLQLLPTKLFNLEACLYSGIVAVVDMTGETPARMKDLAADIEQGKMMGPRLFHCGKGFTGKGAHPGPMMEKVKESLPWIARFFMPEVAIEVKDPADMKRIDKHLAARPDFTKIFLDDLPDGTSKMPPDIVREIVRRSHEKGIPVLIHIGRNEDVRVAIDAGADGIAHNVYKERLDPELARELARRKMFVTPTVYVFHNLNLFMNEKSFYHHSRLEKETFPPNRVKALQNPKPFDTETNDAWGSYYRRLRETYNGVLHPNVAVLKAAGVTIAAGTDATNLGISTGGSLHTELVHLVEGGLTPTEALIAATYTPALLIREVFKREANFGTIEEGKSADLLIVAGDPTKNIRDTQNIVEVFYRGRRLVRHAVP
jgi:imidazolonepropionase-like amidohydrolase